MTWDSAVTCTTPTEEDPVAMIAVNGTELHVQDVGPRDAPALLFCHSLFFDADMFAAQVERFSGEYRVVSYDSRGQGRSAAATLEEQGMDTLAEDAAALIEQLGLAPCHVIGNSMGGFIALRLAARRPGVAPLRGGAGVLRRRRGQAGRVRPAGRAHAAARHR